mmetsp:Transcript_46753/g.100062  ORF Transcript_46753/g.100062 Transcript_46753/m.100062 type:complete len:585 (-) Transcript_46753:101-1855(-)
MAPPPGTRPALRKARTLQNAFGELKAQAQMQMSEMDALPRFQRTKATSFHGTVPMQRDSIFRPDYSPSPKRASLDAWNAPLSPRDLSPSKVAPQSPRKSVPEKMPANVIRMNSKGQLCVGTSKSSKRSTRTISTTDPESPKPEARKSFGGTKRIDRESWRTIAEQASRNLGGHYTRIDADLGEITFDQERDDHDAMLADTLHRRRPSDQPHPLLTSPRAPMKIAFTDRAAKKREGRGVKAVLAKDPHVPTEWKTNADCGCDVCHPEVAPNAGSPSHLASKSRLCRCVRDSPPTRMFWESDVSPTYDSDLFATTSRYATTSGPVPKRSEVGFRRTMGRKVTQDRSPSPSDRLGCPDSHRMGSSGVHHFRSRSADSRDFSGAAGAYNQDYKPEIGLSGYKARQQFQASNTDPGPHRSGVALILSPRHSDPPAPTKILVDRRGDGTYKMGYSKESEQYSVCGNQEVFRFSDPANFVGRPAGPVKLDNHAGMSVKELRERPASPGSPRRDAGMSNASRLVSKVINQDANEKNELAQTLARQKCDSNFISVCNYTVGEVQERKQRAAEARLAHGPSCSDAVKNQLSWQE